MKKNNAMMINLFFFIIFIFIWLSIFLGTSTYIYNCLKPIESFGNEYGVFSDNNGFRYGDNSKKPADTIISRKSDSKECVNADCLSGEDLSYRGEGSGASLSNMLWRSSGPCVTSENKYGVYFGGDASKCVSLEDLNKKMEEAEEKASSSKLPLMKVKMSIDEEQLQIFEPPLPDSDNATDCFPTDSDFDAICRLKNGMDYGLIEKVDCVEEGKVRAKCGRGYVDERKMPGNLTPCMDNSTDFNTLCPFFVSLEDIPEGNTYNSVGVKSILPGKMGGCYQINSSGQMRPDPTKSRAICSTNFVDTLPKLDPIYQYQVKNVFTDCLAIDSNFTNTCKDLLNIDYTDTLATEIEGYDCKPGYARAKCFNLNDKEEVRLRSEQKAFLENIKKFQPGSNVNISS